jgi:hypothetical protein
MFPVLWQYDRERKQRLKDLDCPREVPFAFVMKYRDGCLRNHNQTPERLSERGGLAPQELIAITCDEQNWESRRKIWFMPEEQAVPLLKDLLARFENERQSALEPK